MAKYLSKIANYIHDDSIKRILKDTTMSGDISISFETEPSFFDAIHVLGKKNDVLVVEELESRKIVGVGIISQKLLYIDQEPSEVNYYSSLRILNDHRNGRVLYLGFQELRDLLKKNDAELTFTTIIEDNHLARNLLEKKRKTKPDYKYHVSFSTFVIKPISRSRVHINDGLKIQKGIHGFQPEDVILFLNKQGRKKDFFPVLDLKNLNSKEYQMFNWSNLYIAHFKGEIKGIIGAWDQTSYKQTFIRALSTRIKTIKPFHNLILSKIFHKPVIPNIGASIQSFFVTLIAIEHNDPNIFAQLLDKVSVENAKNYQCFYVGLSESDPLCSSMKYFSNIEYKGLLYLVDYKLNKSLNRIPYIDLAKL